MLVASPSARPSSSTAPDAVVAGRLPAEGPVRLGSVDLPPGRLIAGGAGAGYVAWATVDPVPGSGRVWTALSELHSRTGLVPVHLDGLSGQVVGTGAGQRVGGWPEHALRPWESGEFRGPADPRAADGLDAGAVLAGLWHGRDPSPDGEYDPGDGEYDPGRDVMREFPGLAPPGDVPLSSMERRWALEVVLPRSRRPFRPVPDTRIGLVAAGRPADVPLVIGWEGPVNRGEFLLPLTAVLRSWEDRFGARVIDVGFNDLRLLVERPPRSLEAAGRVAAEHVVVADECAGGLRDVPGIARCLLDNPVWTFWWD